MRKQQNKPPKHLQPATQAWWSAVLDDYDLEQHHVRLLTKACESWDLSEAAREAIAEHGMTYLDRFNCPRARPEIAIEKDSKIAFARLVREIGLDIAPPSDSRPPALRANRG